MLCILDVRNLIGFKHLKAPNQHHIFQCQKCNSNFSTTTAPSAKQQKLYVENTSISHPLSWFVPKFILDFTICHQSSVSLVNEKPPVVVTISNRESYLRSARPHFTHHSTIGHRQNRLASDHFLYVWQCKLPAFTPSFLYVIVNAFHHVDRSG